MVLPDDTSKGGTDGVTRWHSLKAFVYMGDNTHLVAASTAKFLFKAKRRGRDSTSCVFSFFQKSKAFPEISTGTLISWKYFTWLLPG